MAELKRMEEEQVMPEELQCKYTGVHMGMRYAKDDRGRRIKYMRPSAA